MPKVLLLLLLIASVPCSTSASMSGPLESEADRVLASCTGMFGDSIDSTLHLFEVNRLYVLQVSFDPRGRVAELKVAPKRYFSEEHPEWDELGRSVPLTALEYESLLSRLDGLCTKGQLIEASSGTVVTNMRAPYRDRYECAVLVRGEEAGVGNAENATAEIRDFTITFNGSCDKK